MQRQNQHTSLRQEIDTEIARLKTEQPPLSNADIADIINNCFNTNYTAAQIAKQWNEIDRLPKEIVMAIFIEFQRHEIDFARISNRINLPAVRVRKEIIRGMSHTIYKVCSAVRRRGMSKLSKNFISQQQINILVVMMLKPNNLRTVKEEYPTLWNFIAQYNEDSFYRSTSDEQYKSVYRELIQLVELYKINQDFEDDNMQFENNLIRKSHHRDPFAILNDFKKRNNQLTIDLISEDEGMDEEAEHGDMIERNDYNPKEFVEERQAQRCALSEVLEKPIERGQLQGQRFLEQLVVLYAKMSELQRSQKDGIEGLRDQMAQVAVKICLIEHLIGVN